MPRLSRDRYRQYLASVRDKINRTSIDAVEIGCLSGTLMPSAGGSGSANSNSGGCAVAGGCASGGCGGQACGVADPSSSSDSN